MNCLFCDEKDGREPKLGLQCGVCFSCAIERGPKVFDACLDGTFDFQKYKEEGGKQSGTTIQSLILSKDRFESLEDARSWAEGHEFRVEKADETENSFRFRQKAPADFDPNGFGEDSQFRIVRITEGVSATVGFLLPGKAAAADKIEGNTHPPHADGECMPGFRRRGNMCVRIGSSADKEDAVGKRRTHPFVKVDDEKRIVTGPVLVPNTTDLQGDFEFAEDIEKAAHGFMENEKRKIGEQHQIFAGIGVPVESHILRDPIATENKVIPAGTWIMSVKVVNPSTWAKVKDGRITGFSIGFRGVRSEVKAQGTKAAAGGEKVAGLFHLHDIEVHEVSLVDRGAIDEVFIEVKSMDKKANGLKWLRAVIREKISAGVSVGGTGIDSKAIEAIKAGEPATESAILAIASAIGLDGASIIPTKEDENMNEEQVKALVAGLLKPFEKSLDELKSAVADAKGEDANKAEKDAIKAIEAKIEEFEKTHDENMKAVIERFESIAKLIGAKSAKIPGQDEEKKAPKWPSFA